MIADKWGRLTTKTCPGCQNAIGRTCRTCPKCGRIFIGARIAAQLREKGLSDTELPPRKAWTRTGKLAALLKPATLPNKPLDTPEGLCPTNPLVTVFEPDDFDCIAMPDGRLRLVLPSGEVILSARQAKIVAMELRL